MSGKADTQHECPAPGCVEPVPFERLACRSHWYAIPAQLQGRLLREYAENFGEEPYFKARADCLRALGIPENEIAAMNGGIS